MNIITKTKQITETVYESYNGLIFDSEIECLWYEWKQEAVVVFQVLPRGWHGRTPELYSTEEIAQNIINEMSESDRSKYYIEKIFLDIRLGRDKITKAMSGNKILKEKGK